MCIWDSPKIKYCLSGVSTYLIILSIKSFQHDCLGFSQDKVLALLCEHILDYLVFKNLYSMNIQDSHKIWCWHIVDSVVYKKSL